MKSAKKTTKTTLYLPEDMHEQLKIQAARLHTSMTGLIEKAIKQELKRVGKQMKQ